MELTRDAYGCGQSFGAVEGRWVLRSSGGACGGQSIRTTSTTPWPTQTGPRTPRVRRMRGVRSSTSALYRDGSRVAPVPSPRLSGWLRTPIPQLAPPPLARSRNCTGVLPGDLRGSSTNTLIAEFVGDNVYAVATHTCGAAVWNDARNAAGCPAIDSRRMALQSGITPAPRALGKSAPPASQTLNRPGFVGGLVVTRRPGWRPRSWPDSPRVWWRLSGCCSDGS